MIALVFAKGLHRHKIAARAGFGIALAPADFAACDLAHIMHFLLFSAELQQGRPKHPYAKAVQRRTAAELCHFLTQDFGFLRAKASATISFGPIGHRVPLRHAAFEPQLLRVGLEHKIASAPADIFVTLCRRAHFSWAVFLQPGARFGAESFKLGHHALLF